MIQKYLLSSIFFIQGICMLAQVGINNPNPSATLDVIGDVQVRNKLYLEEPRPDTDVTNSKLLVVKENTNEMVRYDIDASSYGPLNYVQFLFQDTSTFGLSDGYNTKISAEKYTLTIHGYYLIINSDQSTDVSFRTIVGSNPDQYMEGQQFYAYIDGG